MDKIENVVHFETTQTGHILLPEEIWIPGMTVLHPRLGTLVMERIDARTKIRHWRIRDKKNG